MTAPGSTMFVVRAAAPADLDQLLLVAAHLDSVNLPHHREHLRQALERSVESFAGTLERAKRELLFVLEERTAAGARIVGTSMIFAQHGNRRAPHVFFDVIDEERYSETIDRHFAHRVLRIGYNYKGLTEMGGLVVVPERRGHPERLGVLLSYVRFLYVALTPDAFCDEILSELMPPLEPDGTSLLWEALGRNFTGLSYQEADRLSRQNKEFIRALFPEEPIYACLLPAAAQALIGQVGPATKGVEAMLTRIGFRYAQRIDPFDGGPHFHATTRDVTLVRDARCLRVSAREGNARNEGEAQDADLPITTHALVCTTPDAGPFRATPAFVTLSSGDTVGLASDDRAALGLGLGDAVGVLPLPAPRSAA